MEESIPLILASASPRRTQLLQAVGIPHRVVVAQVVEKEDPTIHPEEMVLHNAYIKAKAVSDQYPQALVLGADTTVALGDCVLNKPADLLESRQMLQLLSGKEHTVHTGICLLCPALEIDERRDITARVRFKNLSDETISKYQSLVNTLDKAGAYGIQEGKEMIIESYQEPLSTIMGLPVEYIQERLRTLGLLQRLTA